MEKWKAEFLCFVKNKYYVAALVLTAVFSYGFLITHQTVGIDDTPSVYYFEEGLATIVGRCCLSRTKMLVVLSRRIFSSR